MHTVWWYYLTTVVQITSTPGFIWFFFCHLSLKSLKFIGVSISLVCMTTAIPVRLMQREQQKPLRSFWHSTHSSFIYGSVMLLAKVLKAVKCSYSVIWSRVLSSVSPVSGRRTRLPDAVVSSASRWTMSGHWDWTGLCKSSKLRLKIIDK